MFNGIEVVHIIECGWGMAFIPHIFTKHLLCSCHLCNVIENQNIYVQKEACTLKGLKNVELPVPF